MGRQEDLDRMRRFPPDQPSLDQASENRMRVEPRQQAVRSRPARPSKFALWITTLVSIALLVIFTHRTPSMQWFFSSDGPLRNPFFLLTSAPSIDASIPEPGDRILDLTVTQGWNSGHMGIDVALPNGQDSTGIPLYAIGFTDIDVEVICWYEPITGLNVSTYANGMEFAFDYSHLNACITEPGERVVVKAGQQIAEIGNTGAATTGPHLHFQQRKDGTANPITGTHQPGWRTYVELSLSGKTLTPDERTDDSLPAEPAPLLTPRPSSPQRPDDEPLAPQTVPEGQDVPTWPPESPSPADSGLEPTPSPAVPPRIRLSPNTV